MRKKSYESLRREAFRELDNKVKEAIKNWNTSRKGTEFPAEFTTSRKKKHFHIDRRGVQWSNVGNVRNVVALRHYYSISYPEDTESFICESLIRALRAAGLTVKWPGKTSFAIIIDMAGIDRHVNEAREKYGLSAIK